jgi:hypothetical protein
MLQCTATAHKGLYPSGGGSSFLRESRIRQPDPVLLLAISQAAWYFTVFDSA